MSEEQKQLNKVNDYNSTKSFVEQFLSDHPDLFNEGPIYVNFNKRPVKLLVTLAVVDQFSPSEIMDTIRYYDSDLDSVFYNGMIREYLDSRFEVQIKNSRPLVEDEQLMGFEYQYIVIDQETKTKYYVKYTYDSWESDVIEVFYGKDVMITVEGEPVNE